MARSLPSVPRATHSRLPRRQAGAAGKRRSEREEGGEKSGEANASLPDLAGVHSFSGPTSFHLPAGFSQNL